MAPKKRELTKTEWHVLFVAARKTLEKVYKSRHEAPVLPELRSISHAEDLSGVATRCVL